MKRIYLHPIPVRIWHWAHAACIVLLILTGIQIRFADSVSVLTLKGAVKAHNVIGWIVAIDFLLWFISS